MEEEVSCARAIQIKFEIIYDREEDGRWIAEIEQMPGVMVYGDSQQDAELKVEELASRVLQDKG